MIDLATLESTALIPLVGQIVTLSHGDQSATLELTEVRRVNGHKHVQGAREPFSLTFRGQPGLRISQGIYLVEHPDFGAMEIFVTQTGDGPKGSEFESIFS